MKIAEGFPYIKSEKWTEAEAKMIRPEKLRTKNRLNKMKSIFEKSN